MIPGTTRVDSPGRARSEESVRVELEDVLESCYDAGGAVFFSTFSSQIGRLNSVIEANDGRRQIIFVGRSLKEYVESAEKLDLIDTDQIEVVSYFDEVEEKMDEVDAAREDYLVVATGNQGEPGAQLDKMASGTYPFDFEEGDHMIFSSNVIPTPVNEANRHKLETKLEDKGVRIYPGIHTTGHAHKEDHRDFITFLDPEHIVPSHGTIQKLGSYVELAREEGYSLGEDVYISENGKCINLDE
jgi:ribonuclease J